MQRLPSSLSLLCVFCAVNLAMFRSAFADSPVQGIVSSEFIYETAPFPECHASTLVEAKSGLVAAWFGGTKEQDQDVGIWFARRSEKGWSTPSEVADGVESPTKRYPCWNPVLHQPANGPLMLFYKVGPSPSTWWGMLVTSADGGTTWAKPQRLPKDIFGPIKNKAVVLSDGRLLCGASTEDQGWRVHMEWTADLGKNWMRTEPLNDGKSLEAIQPTIFLHGGEKLQILCRGKGTGRIVESWSQDNGKTWSPMKVISLPNPNSGIDGVTLKDGRHLLVYNHTDRGRSPLNVAISLDGKKWLKGPALETEPGEFSYPAVIQSADSLVHITYTWKRKKPKHVVLDPAQVTWAEM